MALFHLISMQETFWGSLCMHFISLVYSFVLSVYNSVILGFLDVCDGPTSWSFCCYSGSGNNNNKKTPQLLGTNWRPRDSQPQELIVQTLCRLCSTFQKITQTHLFPDWLKYFNGRDFFIKENCSFGVIKNFRESSLFW